jgi:hypothetical protein
MAGFMVRNRLKSRQGRKVLADGHHVVCRPCRDSENWVAIFPAINGWAIFTPKRKQKDKAGRPDIDAFEAMMMREDCDTGFIVSFDYSSDAMTEIGNFFKRSIVHVSLGRRPG